LNILVEKLYATPVHMQKVEMVERKGLGHPDHITDLACEAVSRELSRYYMKNYGKILHHNVDKGLLIGGSAQWEFGGGKVIEPIEVTVAGRAVKYVELENRAEGIPVDEIAIKAVKEEIRRNFRFLDPDKHMRIYVKIRPGSAELIKTFDKGVEVPLANDTSIGVAYAPLTTSEELALKLEMYLNSSEYKKIRPYVGEDIKVMVLRIGKKFNVTVASAFVDKFFSNVQDYLSVKEEVYNDILDFISRFNLDYDELNLKLNAADDPENMNIYLTVTGTSAEAGDDGNTGRSNRVNGLITPSRQMSLEAVAGKNPVSHVGKLYNVLAYRISKRIHEEVSGVEEVYTKILSTIGHPINEPQLVNIQYISKHKQLSIEDKVKKILEEEFSPDRLRKLTDEILNGQYLLF